MSKALQGQLWEVFAYDHGHLLYKTNRGRMPKGAEAGCMHTYLHNGHRRIRVRFGGKLYYRYQLIFCMHHGYIPDMIDHINRDPCDDSIENLRECTASENQLNREDRG
jgi:hypothetical protein